MNCILNFKYHIKQERQQAYRFEDFYNKKGDSEKSCPLFMFDIVSEKEKVIVSEY